MTRAGARFSRVEPRRRARAFVLGLLAELPRKTGTPRFLIVRDGKVLSNEFGTGRWAATLADLKKQLGE